VAWYLICLLGLSGLVALYVLARFAVEWYLAGRQEVEMIGGETIFLSGKGRGEPEEHG
jgi:hypothetical protein